MPKKLTVEVSDDMDRILAKLSQKDGMPKTQVLRRAVALLNFLEEEVSDGDRALILRDATTGNDREIVLKSQAL